MKLRQLECALQEVKTFENPKVQFEQYPTPPHIAACILHTIHQTYDDIEGNIVADFGCGGGILAIGASLLDARYCLGIDIDDDALRIAEENCRELEIDNVSLILGDVCNMSWMNARDAIDVVVMNPPFGTKQNKGMDMVFLRQALQVAQKSVYSLHKSTTREHIRKKATEWNIKMEVVSRLEYDIPALYKFHKQKSVDVAVDFIRFSKLNKKNTVKK